MPKTSFSLKPEWANIGQEDFRNALRGLKSLSDVAAFWETKASQLSYYAFHIDKRNAYRPFDVARRNGRIRRIDAPVAPLKYIQRLIHESLSRAYGPHPAVHGFIKGRSVVTNARNHTGRTYVLNVDLEDFFPTITRQRIYGRLTAAPYSLDSKVANLIAALATNQFSQLPQGSPSSPVIANMVASNLDTQLADLCGRLRCRFTRYADDITISTAREMSPDLARYPNSAGTGQVIIGDALRDVIEGNGFRINNRKSRLQSCWTRQMVTGLVVNRDVAPHRAYTRRLRALIHNWRMAGWQSAVELLRDKEGRSVRADEAALRSHVRGRIAYLKMVRGQEDPICRRLEEMVLSLNGSG